MISEERFLYYPSRQWGAQPHEFQLRGEEFRVTTSDGVAVNGIWLKSKTPPLATILFSHGNAGTVADRFHRVAEIQSRLAVDVVLYDYRGFGKSTGSPNEPGTYQDARAVHAFVLSRGARAVDVVLMGESLGCAVAIQLATEVSHRSLILEAPFLSVPAMARHVFPFLPVGPLIRNRYDNAAKIASIQTPSLIVSGRADEVIPFEQGEALSRLVASKRNRFLPISGAHHNDVYVVGGSPYWEAFKEFVLAPAGGS